MRITKRQLKRIIKEEYRRILNEGEGHHFKSGDPLKANYPVVFIDNYNRDSIRIKYGSIDKYMTSAQAKKYGGVKGSDADDTIKMLVDAYGIKQEEAEKFKWFADAKGKYFKDAKNESVSRDQLRNLIRQEYRNIVRENRRRRRY
tara:strand:- start:11 stop:445 length:435 start_codon:yes stop_codon:yes gene_type:complete